jgi:hypothetical protein
MLSACFPLAPLLIIIAHKVEIIQDKYKIIHILKRKLPQSYVGMGSWKYIVVFLCYISIVTVNFYLFRIFYFLLLVRSKLLIFFLRCMKVGKIFFMVILILLHYLVMLLME